MINNSVKIEDKRVYVQRIVSEHFIVVTDDQYNYTVKRHTIPSNRGWQIGWHGWLVTDERGDLQFIPD